MGILQSLLGRFRKTANGSPILPGEERATSEVGMRPIPGEQWRYMYRRMWVDSELQATIAEIREFDLLEPRVKRIHSNTARAAVKGGLTIRTASANEKLIKTWGEFERRLRFTDPAKLKSHMRRFLLEGNLALQWVVDGNGKVVDCVSMPAETIVPLVDKSGRFVNPAEAYAQYDLDEGKRVAVFPLWKLQVVRLDPYNWDDYGSLGRPYLDAARTPLKKLLMTEEDLVLRRKMRAPLRMSHVLEGASKEELEAYEARIEAAQANGISTDYYLNKKGSVQAVQGDSQLGDIDDVLHLLRSFFAGAPGPAGLFGYGEGLSRDIFEELRRAYYDELDSLQDSVAVAYRFGFELDLLLSGIDPQAFEFEISFAERRTETPNQSADRALKLQALGVAKEMVWDTAGVDPSQCKAQLDAEKAEFEPYIDMPVSKPNVSITPGNARNGESATTISTRSTRV